MHSSTKKQALSIALALYLTSGMGYAFAGELNQTVSQNTTITENTQITVTQPNDGMVLGAVAMDRNVSITKSNPDAKLSVSVAHSGQGKLGAYGVGANGKTLSISPATSITATTTATTAGNHAMASGVQAYTGTINFASDLDVTATSKNSIDNADSKAYGIYSESGTVNVAGNATIKTAATGGGSAVYAYGMYAAHGNINVAGKTDIQSIQVDGQDIRKASGVVANAGDNSLVGAGDNGTLPNTAVGTTIINLHDTDIKLSASEETFGVRATTGRGKVGEGNFQDSANTLSQININGNVNVELKAGSSSSADVNAGAFLATGYDGGQKTLSKSEVNVNGLATVKIEALADKTSANGNLLAAAGYAMGNAAINFNGGLKAEVKGNGRDMNGTEVYGLLAEQGSQINVNGPIDIKVYAQSSNEVASAAIAKSGSTINMNMGEDFACHKINIIGDLGADAHSKVNIGLGADGSTLEGKTMQFDNGQVNIALNTGTKWKVSDDSDTSYIYGFGGKIESADKAVNSKYIWGKGLTVDNTTLNVSNELKINSLEVINGGSLLVDSTAEGSPTFIAEGSFTAKDTGSLIDMKLGINSRFNGALNSVNGGIANLSLKDGAVWAATADSTVDNLTLQGGTVTTNSVNSITVDIKTLKDEQNGNGNFIVYANTALGTTDTIKIDGENVLEREFNGENYTVSIVDKNPGTNIGSVIAENLSKDAAEAVATNSTTIAQSQPKVDAGVFRYSPVYSAQGNASGKYDVVLSGGNHDGQKSTVSMAAEGSVGASLSALRNTANELQKRMGELRDTKSSGIWARHYAQKDNGDGFNSKTNSFQVGIDKHTALKNGDLFTGIAVSHGKTDTTLEGISGSGDGSNTSFGIYASYLAKDNQYVDVIAKYGKFNSKYNAYKLAGGLTSGEYDQKGYSISVEYGKKFTLKNGAYITPHAELLLGRLCSADYLTSDGVIAKVGAGNMFTLRGGATLGKDFETKNGINNVYMRALVAHEFAGNSNLTMQDGFGTKGEFKVGGSSTWFELALGGTFKLSKQAGMYVEAERSFGGKVTSPWKYNIGLRVGFK